MESHYNPPSAVSSAEVPLQTPMNGVGAVSKSLEGVGMWQLLLTVLVLSVTYDQGMGNKKKTKPLNEQLRVLAGRTAFRFPRFSRSQWIGLADACSRLFFFFIRCSQIHLEQG